jgi:hypothetical protein
VCDHDGLDEECPGRSCRCVCMSCIMGTNRPEGLNLNGRIGLVQTD